MRTARCHAGDGPDTSTIAFIDGRKAKRKWSGGLKTIVTVEDSESTQVSVARRAAFRHIHINVVAKS